MSQISPAQEAALELMDDMRAMMERGDFEEAAALVVVSFDPETCRRSIHGPFPKDGTEATRWAAKTLRNWEASNKGDGPDLVYTIELLFHAE